MSSTNRGGERAASDYYVTPIPAIENFLRAWWDDFPEVLAHIERISDPCSGGTMEGKILTKRMSYPTAIENCRTLFPQWIGTVKTMDIRLDSPANIHADYLNSELGTNSDLIISNPPFCLASQFIRKALQDVKTGGYVAFLLRLNFLGGTTEKPKLWADVGLPVRVYVHAKRMSFTGGRTDSIEYMHAIWRSGVRATETILKVI